MNSPVRLSALLVALHFFGIQTADAAVSPKSFLLRLEYVIADNVRGDDLRFEVLIFRDGLTITKSVQGGAGDPGEPLGLGFTRSSAGTAALAALHAALATHHVGLQAGDCHFTPPDPFDRYEVMVTWAATEEHLRAESFLRLRPPRVFRGAQGPHPSHRDLHLPLRRRSR